MSFAHRLLWESAHRHLDLAREHPQDEWMLHISAGLLAAAAFEAYLNYVGDELLPLVWAEEKVFFSRDPYKGTNGKLKRIAEEVHWELPARGRKPISGVRELQSIRDRLVHARPKREAFRVRHAADRMPPFPTSWLSKEASASRICKLIGDVEALAEELHSAIKRSDLSGLVFGSHPFQGAVGVGHHSVSAEERAP